MSSYMQVVCLLCILLLTLRISKAVKIGLLCDTNPNSWQYLFGIAGAVNFAIDQLIEDGVIQNETVSR